jgi:hypothetical protein
LKNIFSRLDALDALVAEAQLADVSETVFDHEYLRTTKSRLTSTVKHIKEKVIIAMVSNTESKNFNEALTPSSSTSSIKKMKMGLKKVFKPVDHREPIVPSSESTFANIKFRVL